MRALKALLIILCIVFNQGVSAEEPVQEMTLEDSVALALRNSRDVKKAYYNRVLQEYDLKLAESEFLPNIRLDARGNLSIDSTEDERDDNRNRLQTEKYDAGIQGSVSHKIPTGGFFEFIWDSSLEKRTEKQAGVNNKTDQSSTAWSVAFTQPLLRGGGIDFNTANLKRADMTFLENTLALRDTVSDTIAQAISAYNEFYRAYRDVDIRRDALKRAMDQVDNNRLLISVGRMASSELIQSESQVSNDEFSLQQAENSLDQARLNLLDVLDMDQTLQIKPVDEIQLKEVTPDKDQCASIMKRNYRPYIVAKNNVSRADLSVMEAKNRRLWYLNLVSKVGDDYTWVKDGDDSKINDWAVGLEFTAPFEIFGTDYLLKKMDILGSRKEAENAKLDLQETIDDMQTRLLNAVREVYVQLKLVEQARRSVELAKQKLEIEQEKLSVGRSTNFQVLSFQNDLVRTEQAENNQAASYIGSLTALDLLLGTTLETWQVEFRTDVSSEEAILSQDPL